MNTHETPDDRPPLFLIPGYWLGAWAWDRVVAQLQDLGQPATPVTLPGLESPDSDRSSIRFQDHVDAVLDLLHNADAPGVLVAHSGAGAVITAVADAEPGLIRRIVYVDSGPSTDGSIPVPDLPADARDLPFPGLDALAAEGTSIDGIGDADKERFQDRAVPHPAGAVREPIRLHDPRRNDVPVTLVCCSINADTLRGLVASGVPMFAAVQDLTAVDMVDLPTGHWPMFSRPGHLAGVITEVVAGV